MFNKSEIMKAAWDSMRNMKFADHAARMRWFSRQLKQAWFDAKMALHRAQISTADRIREAILCLDCKDRPTARDHAELARLRNALTQALAAENKPHNPIMANQWKVAA
ncbi:MAG: hypothetical protein AAF701_08110 [Pseudomonadota bacterium]